MFSSCWCGYTGSDGASNCVTYFVMLASTDHLWLESIVHSLSSIPWIRVKIRKAMIIRGNATTSAAIH